MNLFSTSRPCKSRFDVDGRRRQYESSSWTAQQWLEGLLLPDHPSPSPLAAEPPLQLDTPAESRPSSQLVEKLRLLDGRPRSWLWLGASVRPGAPPAAAVSLDTQPVRPGARFGVSGAADLHAVTEPDSLRRWFAKASRPGLRSGAG